MKIFLDDDMVKRPTPEGFIRTQTAEETWELVKAGGVVELSLDNDLGSGYTEGYWVMRWLEAAVVGEGFQNIPEKYRFHTHNPDRKNDMKQAIRNIMKHLGRRFDVDLSPFHEGLT